MSDNEVRALRELVSERRSEPTPEIDWDRVEQQLMEKVESDAPAPLPRPSPWPALAFVAAAAAIVIAGIGVIGHFRHATTPHAPVAQVLRTPTHHVFGVTQHTLSGDKLAVGDRVVATTHAVRVEHTGRVVWTLAPYSQATVAVKGRYLTVRLDKGSVTADVVPSPLPESFAVEVERTRIAVHGTHFTVQRIGDHAKVTLVRGVVAVGPSNERGHTTGWLMKAPATGTFSLDGARTGHVEQGKPANAGTTAPAPPTAAPPAAPAAPVRAAPAPKSKRAPAPAAPAVAPAPAAKQPAPPLPDQPAEADLDSGADQVAATVRSCFTKNTASGKGMRISADSKLSIDVGPAGNITTLRFNPPLAPSVQRCSAGVMQSVHFPASKQGATVTRTLVLER